MTDRIMEKKRKTLKEIVDDKDLVSLEAFCLQYDYASIVRIADSYEIDPDTLEELLDQIS